MLIKSISHAIDGRLNALTDLLWMILDVIYKVMDDISSKESDLYPLADLAVVYNVVNDKVLATLD